MPANKACRGSLLLLLISVACYSASASSKKLLQEDPSTQHGVQRSGPKFGHCASSYYVGLWGDMPYSEDQALNGVPNLIADMNGYPLAFTVFNGDWKPGSPVVTNSQAILNCSDAFYTKQIAGYLNALQAPAMYTPGDNEWTDCDGKDPKYNSLERLDLIRKTFFYNNNKSFGQKKMKLEVQNDNLCLSYAGPMPAPVDAQGPYKNTSCVENRRWEYRGVMYMTLHQVGSCNNLCKDLPDPKEWAARNSANIKWMKETFAKAMVRKSAAVMIIAQADPGFEASGFQGAPKRDPITLELLPDSDPADGFKEFMVTLRQEVIAFKKPVNYVHGDSHWFMIDKPLLDDKGVRLVNFTRVQTFGDNQNNGNNDIDWVMARVDTSSHAVFHYTPMVVTANNPGQGV